MKYLICLIIFLQGCGSLFKLPFQQQENISTTGFLAEDFPMFIGKQWQYACYQRNNETTINEFLFDFTVKITELREVQSKTCFVLTNDAKEAIEHFYGFWYFFLPPLQKSYFSFDKGIFVEHGFSFEEQNQEKFYDLVPSQNLLNFPLEDKKTWTVSSFFLVDGIKCEYRRTSYKERTPKVLVYNDKKYYSSTYNIYYIIEDIYLDGYLTQDSPVAKYWIAKGIGIIKYEFIKRDEKGKPKFITILYKQ